MPMDAVGDINCAEAGRLFKKKRKKVAFWRQSLLIFMSILGISTYRLGLHVHRYLESIR